MLNGICLLVNSCLKGKDGRDFCIALWLGTKNEFITIIPSAENHAEFPAMLPRRRPNRIVTAPRSCSILGPARRSVLWTVKIGWNNHRRSVSNAIDAFEHWKTNGCNTTRGTIKFLQHDNAQLHVAKVVKTYLETLKWEVLSHPPYSPDVAPSDYHLFRSMPHGLADQHFRSYEEVKNWIDSWIASKDDQFFRRGIRTLSERWEKVVVSDGQYFES